MKKSLVLFIMLVFVFTLFSFSFAATLPVEDAVYGANITSWYPIGDKMYLDTSINFDFDKFNIEDIQWIRFSLMDENNLIIAQRFSTNKNLDTLLSDAAQYWGRDYGDYADMTGIRILSCAFTSRHGGNNGYWVSSGAELDVNVIPAKLLVQVKINEHIYTSEWIRP